MSEENVVYIGTKPLMNYVLAVVTQMNNGRTTEVMLKARGRSISRAVDVAEVVRNKFILEAELGTINISTEEVSNREGSNSNISAIEIQLTNMGTP